MNDAPILVEMSAGVGRIIFNRPAAMNAIDVATAEAFRDGVGALLGDGARVIVMTGTGRAFVAGGDLAAFRETDDRAAFARRLITPIHDGLAALAAAPAISIAAVNGAAAGAGMSLALAADLCIAAEGASFTTAYARVAAPGDCGLTWALPQALGPRKALELMLLSPTLSAAEALSLGLVNRVVAERALEPETDALAARLAAGPVAAIARIKALIRQPARNYGAHLDAERAGFADCADTDDFAEAVEAFFARRKSSFGRA